MHFLEWKVSYFVSNFLIEKFYFLFQISLKFVPEGPVDNKWVLVQVMAWRWIGNKPLFEPIMTKPYVVLPGHNELIDHGPQTKSKSDSQVTVSDGVALVVYLWINMTLQQQQ